MGKISILGTRCKLACWAIRVLLVLFVMFCVCGLWRSIVYMEKTMGGILSDCSDFTKGHEKSLGSLFVFRDHEHVRPPTSM